MQISLKKYNFFLIFILFFSCNFSTDQEEVLFEPEVLEASHKFLAQEEKFRIERFVTRSNLKFLQTGTGLFFHLTRKGIGSFIEVSDIVFLDFKVKGLDGTFYYQNPFEQPLELMVGKFDIASGLHEALAYLQLGSKATLILPSHLAYGLLGDREKIPPRMPILWEIHILKVIKKS